jgi:hypothetical protein
MTYGAKMMLSIREIESCCDASRPLDFSKSDMEGSELSHKGMFYPLGFPAEVRTNRIEVLEIAGELWGRFQKQHDTEAVRLDVHVHETEGPSIECPPVPKYRFMMQLLMTVADADNYAVCDLEQNKTQISVSSAVMRNRLYMGSLFLGPAPGPHTSSRHITPVHAACVALDGKGVLLCGDSGAGKSSLSYACARAGWTYIADDASFLLNSGTDRMVMGNCHQVRFRPTATELFPELVGLGITPRLVGKPSIELPTAPMPHMVCAQTARADFMVFLNRHSGGPSELVPYRIDVARHYMRQVLYGSAKSLATQYEVVERLLTAEILELRYTDLNWAIQRLQRLVQEGC